LLSRSCLKRTKQLLFRITIWYVPVANCGFDGQVTNLEAKLNESSGTLAGSGVHCWLDPHPRVTAVAKRAQPPRRLPPHPRVTAVAKRAQPPRRLPSPQGARDLRKGSGKESHCPLPLYGRGIFGKRRLPCPVTSGRGILGKRRLPYPATRGRGILQKALKYSHAAQFSLHG
jgi:hypothetical protein